MGVAEGLLEAQQRHAGLGAQLREEGGVRVDQEHPVRRLGWAGHAAFPRDFVEL